MIGIVLSEKDIAAGTMLPLFLGSGFEPVEDNVWRSGDKVLIRIEPDIIFADSLDGLATKYGLDYIVMASRHRSESEKPTLTVHATGNFSSDNTYGGSANELQMTIANPMRNVYLEMLECELPYEVSREATHHGPTKFKTPLFFAELGSSERQWRDGEAAGFLVGCILRGVGRKSKADAAIAFGGGHYCPKFSTMEDVAFSHICPKYAMDSLTPGLVEQMAQKTEEEVNYALLDEKGLKGRQKSMVKAALDSIGIEH